MDTWVQFSVSGYLCLLGFWHNQCPLRKPFIFQNKEMEVGFPLSCSWHHNNVTQKVKYCIFFIFPEVLQAFGLIQSPVCYLKCDTITKSVAGCITKCYPNLLWYCSEGFNFVLRRTPIKQIVLCTAIWHCIVSCTNCPGPWPLIFFL